MKRLTFLLLLFVALLETSTQLHAAEHAIVIVGNANVPKLDIATLRRIYTGKAIEVDGVRVTPLNATAGLPLRQRFLADFLATAENDYLAYWTVRRHIGKGTPPAELKQTADVISYVNRTPGAIAYLDEADVPRGMNIILRN